MIRGTSISKCTVRMNSSSGPLKSNRAWEASRQEVKLKATYWPSSMVMTSASSLNSRQKARRTEITWTAMKNLFRTRTLPSRAQVAPLIMDKALLGCVTEQGLNLPVVKPEDRPRNKGKTAWARGNVFLEPD